ncbi:MAG: DUF4091 domain-containing protein [Lentisphaeria bacterium]|nr:DUF4091 domain-containing protein [Lentisphaeria bacterium]
MIFEAKCISSLEKIFPEQENITGEISRISALLGETVSFQIACRSDSPYWLSAETESGQVEIREVALAPSEFVASDDTPAVLRKTPGLYPDPLLPLNGPVRMPPNQWRALWITLRTSKQNQPGTKTIKITVKAKSVWTGETEQDCLLTLELLPAELPEQTLTHTEWFHTDCIYTYYKVPCWSEEHWNLLEKYFKNFTAHGINLLLTPLWTPPLDTAVNGERPTVQLLDITYKNGVFQFDFAKLGRWIDLALKCGVKYFEMAHPFTQWGAKCCPKIMVDHNGTMEKMFGWHTSSLSTEYIAFLRTLYPQLLAFLKEKGIAEKCYFHISDEPSPEHLENYKACSKIIRELVGDLPVIDALSHVDFYLDGTVKHPIPANNMIEDFVQAKVSPLWTYYCISQQKEVPNRFFNFPSYRNRIMGVLMYRYGISGFLQWGYNFWYTQYSLKTDIDPFRVTDSGRAFCSGDAFLVYPGENGPVDSIRNEIQFEATQDLGALQKLESLIGRENVLAMIHEGLDYELTMKRYPYSAEWLLDLRERINRAIAENL